MNPQRMVSIFHKHLADASLPNIRTSSQSASILLSMDVNPKIVQELLRHSHKSITLGIYSHIFPSMQKKALNRLDDLFNRDARE